MKLLAAAVLFVSVLPLAADPGRDLFEKTCAACHGKNGEGDARQKTPSIASMPKWYIARQIHKFRTDVRGVDPKDAEGLRMRSIAHTLDDSQVEPVAAFVESLARTPTRHTLKGDRDKGRALYREFCMECHRFNASGELVFGSPPLTGLQDWYILGQLLKFRAGVRGTHPADEHGAKMHKRAGILTEEQLRDVASFIAELAEEYPESRNKGE